MRCSYLENEILVRRCQAGDREAFAALFRRYTEPVLRTAYLITGNRAVAEEVMQESFAQAFRSIGGLREVWAFGPWLFRIAVRLARRTAARERAGQKLAAVYARLWQADAVPVPDDLAARDRVWECVARLPERQRTVLVLHYYLDRPVSEVAAIMEAPVGTVKSWLHRARAALATELGTAAGGTADG